MADQHDGTAYPPERSVFVNCPFDKGFKPQREAIFLATVACDYIPRSADTLEYSTARMDRIDTLLRECRYSIHDLSRCQGSSDWRNYARFNMPLELGMAMSIHHKWMALLPSGHEHLRFVSDLGGYDLPAVEADPEEVIHAVVAWLIANSGVVTTKPPKVFEAFPDFRRRVAKIELDWRKGIPLEVLLEAARDALA